MHPDISLDRAIVAANARAWQAFAGVRLYAVVKADGYGWGMQTLVDALDGLVSAFCVLDEEELWDLRHWTATRAIVLGTVPLERLADVLAADAYPTIASEAEIDVATRVARERGRPLRLRIGLRPAVGWTGSSDDELRDLAPLLARADAEIELWSHLTDFHNREQQRARFEAVRRVLSRCGVRIAGTDVASTFPVAADGARETAVRIGVGLFGATGGHAVPGVRCALRVTAPIARSEVVVAGTKVGYGTTAFERPTTIATARCGYSDGLPSSLAGRGDIVSIGMQYFTAQPISRSHGPNGAVGGHTPLGAAPQIVLLDETSDLDAFAVRAGRLPHEIVTAFGNAASARAARVRSR